MTTTAVSCPSVDEILSLKSIPTLPAVAIEIVRLCGDDSVDVDDLADAISRDPALASKLLKLANSPKYCRREPISNMNRALVLGLKTLKVMSLSFSLAGAATQKNVASCFDFETFWHHSVCKAVVGRGWQD